MTYTKERLEELSIQHGLDGGGYAFEACADIDGVVECGEEAFDYLLGETPAQARGESARFLFCPHDYHEPSATFPEALKDENDETSEWVRVELGSIYEHETDCDCHGHAGADGWEYTGNVLDPAHPDCERCEGTGFLVVEPGTYAVYVRREIGDE